MRAPIAPSSVYIKQGKRPVYWQGMVLWLSGYEYQRVAALMQTGQMFDATEEQIEAQDRWYESAKAEREREAEDFRRMFQTFTTRPAAAPGQEDAAR